MANEVQFLGFILSTEDIRPSPDKIDAIQRFPTSQNNRQLQLFLDICNYYRKFKQDYLELTAKFQPQLSTKNKYKWVQNKKNMLPMIEKNF